MCSRKTLTSPVSPVCDETEQPEFDFSYESAEEIVAKRLPNGRWRVGYLMHDEDSENPCEVNDAEGQVFSCHRHAGQASWEGYRKARGLENWQKHPLRHPDPNAVLLDCYDHSGQVWAISGSDRARTFPDQQWDVAHGGGVWVPNTAALENIWLQVMHQVLPGAQVEYYSHKSTSGKECRKYVLRMPGGAKPRYFKSYLNAAKAALTAYRKIYPDSFQQLWREALLEYCEGVLEDYNAWSSGDCWGHCVEEFDEEGQRVGEPLDACWGHLGLDHAKSCRDEAMED